jgi:hypothetical protein
MTKILRKRSLKKSTNDSVLVLKKHQKPISSGDRFTLEKPVRERSILPGLKITKVTFQNNEYIVKANRYLLLMILQQLLDNNKIDLKEDLPLKINSTNERCILNDKLHHPNDYKMKDIHSLKNVSGKLFAETKLDTHTIHNGCYSLLRRYKIPIEDLKVEYSKKRPKADSQYKDALKKIGYCRLENTNLIDDLKTDLNSEVLVINQEQLIMNNGDLKSECICGLPLKPFQYEPICTEDGETFRRWSCSCGYIGEEHYNSELDFIGMLNFYKPEQEYTDICCDDVDFFDGDDVDFFDVENKQVL